MQLTVDFLTGPPASSLQVGYREYNAVPSDPNPLPPASFGLSRERGLNGGSGALDSGGDTDKPSTRAAGTPAESPAANGLLATLLPGGGPSTCSFAIILNTYSENIH